MSLFPKNIVVIVPTARYIEPACEEGLRRLEAKGYTVWRPVGNADIARSRSILATSAIEKGFSGIMWIDSDMVFDDNDVDKLVETGCSIVGAICARRDSAGYNCVFFPDTDEVVFGVEGGLLKVKLLGTGFLYTSREAYSDIRNLLNLPCFGTPGAECFPYFLHEQADIYGTVMLLSEDYSFCIKADKAKHSVFAHTGIRVGHLGSYAYTWEDVVFQRKLNDTVHVKVTVDMRSTSPK